VDAAEAEATIAYLVPGFVALKIFYVVGLRTRRSDLGWTVLSVAAAAGLNAAVVYVTGVSDYSWRAVDATALGVVAAVFAGGGWRWLRGRYPTIKSAFDRQAWDAIWSRPAWVQVWVRDGPIVLGAPRVVAESAETDDLDVYLVNPSWVDRSTGERKKVVGVVGIWVAARNVQLIQVLDPDFRAPAAAAAGTGAAHDAGTATS
jgi:hypothetical protein